MAEKAPAFQFYAKDWLSDMNVKIMTPEERGGYIQLMAIEWNEGGLPKDDMDLAVLSGLGEKWGGISGERIKKCFRVRGEKLIHPRLEKEREKQSQRRLKCSLAGEASATARKNKGKQATSVERPLNKRIDSVQLKSNSSFASPSSSLKNKDYSQSSNELRLAILFYEKIKERKPDFKKPNLQLWAKGFDTIIRIDKRAIEKVEKIIDWCQQDSFWQNNILSPLKLRKQFDHLELKMNQDKMENPEKVEALICTEENPKPIGDKRLWRHKDFIEIEKRGSYTTLKCSYCNFTTEKIN